MPASEAPVPGNSTGGSGVPPVGALRIITLGLAHAACMLAAFVVQETFVGGVFLNAIPTLLMIEAIVLAARAARHITPRRRPFLWALLFGLATTPFWLVTHFFIWAITGPGFIPLLLHFCLYPAAFVWLLARLTVRRPRWPLWLTVPSLWVGLEVLRGEYVWSGYPWYLAGHAATALFREFNPGNVIGAYGVSFLLALLAGMITAGPTRRDRAHDDRKWWFLIRGLTTAIVFLLAGIALSWPPASATPEGRPFRIAVLQTNLPQDNKLAWKLEDRLAQAKRWYALTAQAAASTPKPDAIFWPETMFPGNALNPEALRSEANAVANIGLGYSLPDPAAPNGEKHIPASWFADELIRIQKEGDVPIIVGALAADGQRFDTTTDYKRISIHVDARYNSAILIRNGLVQSERYDKMDLMPFGEYIPVLWRWPALQNQAVSLGAAGMAFDLHFGQYRTVFQIPMGGTGVPPAAGGSATVRIVTPICFEGSYTRSCRRLVADDSGGRRADLMVNLTNDGWFGSMGSLSDFSRRMHLLNCRWRCIELGTPMVRAANTGVSCVIDHRGRVLLDTLDPITPNGPREPSPRREGLMTADVPLLPATAPTTIYARYGHWLEPLMGFAALALALVALFAKPRV